MCQTCTVAERPEPHISESPVVPRNPSAKPFTGPDKPPADNVDVHVSFASDYTPSIAPTSKKSAFLPTLLILLSSLLFSGMHICVRNATTVHHISVLLIAFSRGLFQFFVSGALIVFLGFHALTSSLTSVSILTLALRGILGALATVCKYAALSRLPVAVASALFATSSLFAMLFGYLFVGEVLSLRDGVALIITTLGAGLVGSRAGLVFDRSDDGHGFGVTLALLAASLTGATFVTIRKLGSKVHFLLSMFALSVGSMVAPVALQAAEGGRFLGSEVPGLGREEVMALGGVGMFAFAAAACINRGLQMTTAGRAALLRTCDIPVNFVVAAVVLGEVPNDMRQVVGCVLIAMSMYVVASGKGS